MVQCNQDDHSYNALTWYSATRTTIAVLCLYSALTWYSVTGTTIRTVHSRGTVQPGRPLPFCACTVHSHGTGRPFVQCTHMVQCNQDDHCRSVLTYYIVHSHGRVQPGRPLPFCVRMWPLITSKRLLMTGHSCTSIHVIHTCGFNYYLPPHISAVCLTPGHILTHL